MEVSTKTTKRKHAEIEARKNEDIKNYKDIVSNKIKNHNLNSKNNNSPSDEYDKIEMLVMKSNHNEIQSHSLELDNITEESVYDVEQIVGKRIRKGKIYYLVKWDGYPSDQNTWEPIDNLLNVIDLIEEYEKVDNQVNNKKVKKTRIKINDTSEDSLSLKDENSMHNLIDRYKEYGINEILNKEKTPNDNILGLCISSVNTSHEAHANLTLVNKNIEKIDINKVTKNNTSINSVNKNKISNQISKHYQNNSKSPDLNINIPRLIKYAKFSDKKMFFMIEWEKRKDGSQPGESLLTHEFVKKNYPYILIEFYEARIRCVKMDGLNNEL
jgi:hypothetical protein